MSLKENLNGYGRIVYFTSSDPDLRPENSTLVKIQEGRFLLGLPDGYCRIINAAGEGSVEVGYYTQNQPEDKNVRLDLNGEVLGQGKVGTKQ